MVIKEAYENGWIKVVQLDEKQTAMCQRIMEHDIELHLGEFQAMLLTRERGKEVLLLMDDSSGRAFAETWGLKVKGVLYVVMSALHK